MVTCGLTSNWTWEVNMGLTIIVKKPRDTDRLSHESTNSQAWAALEADTNELIRDGRQPVEAGIESIHRAEDRTGKPVTTVMPVKETPKRRKRG